jgi:hypothetical protein
VDRPEFSSAQVRPPNGTMLTIFGWHERTRSGRVRGLPGPARWNLSWSNHQVGEPRRITALAGGDQPRIWTSCGPHPGSSVNCLLDADGHRITAFLANSPRWHGPFLDARRRPRGRCENQIMTLKNTGLGKLPFFNFRREPGLGKHRRPGL